MQNSELVKIQGGAAISSTAINAIIRAVNLSLELGRIVGSAIKRKISGKYKC